MRREAEHEGLHAYLDGELDAAGRAAFEAHLDTCAPCRESLAALRALQAELAARPVPDPGPGYWNEFAARVECSVRGAAGAEPARTYERLSGWLFPRGQFAWLRAAGAVAACTLVLYVGMRGFRPQETGIPAPGPTVTAPVPAAPRPPLEASRPEEQRKTARDEAIGPVAKRPSQPRAKLQTPNRAAPAPDVAETPGASPPPQDRAELQREPQVAPPTRTSDVLEPGPAPEAALSPLAAAAPAPPPHVRGIAPPEVAPPEGSRALGVPKLQQPPAAAPEPPDAAARFVLAAIAGDTAVARALARDAGADLESRASMLRWLDLVSATPVTTAGKASGGRIASEPVDLASRDVEALLALDALAWPGRARAGSRPAVERLAEELVRRAADARATTRAAAYLEWLADTTQRADESARWRALLGTLPQR